MGAGWRVRRAAPVAQPATAGRCKPNPAPTCLALSRIVGVAVHRQAGGAAVNAQGVDGGVDL